MGQAEITGLSESLQTLSLSPEVVLHTQHTVFFQYCIAAAMDGCVQTFSFTLPYCHTDALMVGYYVDPAI